MYYADWLFPFLITFVPDEKDEVNNILYAGTAGQGILKLDLNTITGVSRETHERISSFRLYGNYPNPFNQCTMISYQLSMISKVKLEIYNTLGQLVRVLVDEEKQAGEYRVMWDGKDMRGKDIPSGVYVYRLKAGDFSEVRKMVVLR